MSFDTGSAGGERRSTTLGDQFYPLYRRLFNSDGEFIGDLSQKLDEARIPQTVEMYLSRALAYGVLVGAVFWVLATAGLWLFVEFYVTEVPRFTDIRVLYGPALDVFNAVKLPLIVGALGIFCGLVGVGLVVSVFVGRPYLTANSREREINVLLADSVSFMYALSIGGMNQLEIVEAIAKAEDTYGEVAKEFQAIVLETEYFDTDYRTAIRNQSMRTPSDEFSQFLTDMLSIIDSGGNMTDFLDDKKRKHLRTAKQEQSLMLETLELFGEMYITLSLFPLLMIIVLVIMSMIGTSQTTLLYMTVYGLLPMLGIAFMVLVSTVKQDEVGDGYLRLDGERTPGKAKTGLASVGDLGSIEGYIGGASMFDRIADREGTYRTKQLLKQPHYFFRDHPLTILALTVPASVVLVGFGVASGLAPLSIDGFIESPVVGTAIWVYVPLYVNFLPLAVFYEWNVLSRNRVTGKLSGSLRKLASANNTGMTLLESLKVTADTSSGKLSDEFATMHRKVSYGVSLKTAMVEFNNRYHVPRLARTVNVISKAQEASSQIGEVLSTAAVASENQDDIEREQKSRARMQVAIILMTYFTLLGVMAILKLNFLDTMAQVLAESGSGGGAAGGAGGSGAAAGGFGANVNVPLMTLLFFHAVTIQAVLSGFVAGYIRSGDLLTGVKFAVALPTFALIVFAFIT